MVAPAQRRAVLVQLAQGWQDVGRPAFNLAAKTFFAARLDLALAVGLSSVAPGGLGLALSRGVRLLVAARVARSHEAARSAAAVDEGSDEDEAIEGSSSNSSSSRRATSRRAWPTAGSDSQQAGAAGSGAGSPEASRPFGRRRKRALGPLPKGLGTAPPLPIPALPPGALSECSVQPLGLPMMLVGQSAARAPMYASRGVDRLTRGLLGLAASFLLTRVIRTPFTGRLARLPPRFVESIFHSVVGPAAAVSYLSSSAAGQSAGPADAALCRRATPQLQHLYSQLRGAGQAEAARQGRPVAFAGAGATVEAVPRADINAVCLPGGIVYVHSGLLKAVNGRNDSLSFVLGHEVGHAIGRHSLEKATSMYTSMFAVDLAMGLAERLLNSLAAGPKEEERAASRLKALDGLLQSGVYLLQLRQSRQHEYEADQLALALGSGAGMNRGALFYGAEDVLRKFMQMEAGSAGASLPPGAPQGDSPLSTHPAAVNRLRRLSELVTRLP
ncbi:hypothetical protein ABPG77_009684 [Micractinium sp. CCAP 211/92]